MCCATYTVADAMDSRQARNLPHKVDMKANTGIRIDIKVWK